MAAPIGVNRRPVSRFGHCLDGCIQHRVDQPSVRTGPSGPVDDHSIEAVDDGREVHLASRDLELRDVGEPFLVRDCGLEVAVDEVLRRWTDLAKV